MVIPSPNINNNEQAKFLECPSGETAVRTCIANPASDPVNVTGGAAVSGQTSWLVTTQDIGDTAEAIPATPLANRNSMTILNLDTNLIVRVGPADTVTDTNAEGITYGYPIQSESEYNVDLDDSAAIFAIAPAGETIRIQIVEYAKA